MPPPPSVRGTLVNQGRGTYSGTKGDKGYMRCLRLKITASLGSNIYNSSFQSLNEIDELTSKPDWSNFHPDEVNALRGFYLPIDTTVPHDHMIYVKETPLAEALEDIPAYAPQRHGMGQAYLRPLPEEDRAKLVHFRPEDVSGVKEYCTTCTRVSSLSRNLVLPRSFQHLQEQVLPQCQGGKQASQLAAARLLSAPRHWTGSAAAMYRY